MREINVASGASVKIGVAGWADAVALKSAIASELIKGDMNIQLDFDKDIDVGQFAKLVLLVDSSKTVYDALFKCLAKCTYNGQSINTGTFEPVEARQDYYEIAFECLKENLGPFFDGLFSRLKPFMEKYKQAEKAPKLK